MAATHSASHYLIHILYKITNSPQGVIVSRWSQSNLYPPRIGFERKLPSLAHLLESSYFDSATAEPLQNRLHPNAEIREKSLRAIYIPLRTV